MTPGKEKCEYLRTIRRKLAEANGIEFELHECHHEGPCPGTCPLCDQELQLLQQQLEALEESGAEVRYDVLTPEEMIFLAEERILPEDDDDSVEVMGDIILAGMPMPVDPDEGRTPRMPHRKKNDDDFLLLGDVKCPDL